MRVKLSELEATFIRVTADGWERISGELEQAQGVEFLCPKCFLANGGAVGTHLVLCWFADRGVPDYVHPIPGRWVPAGTNLEDLTFVGPNAASVLLTGGCQWHGFIKQGYAT